MDLCAYVVSGKTLSEPGLKAYLAADFPHYMIPLKFVRLEKMPFTPAGKIDRTLLQSIEVGTEEEVETRKDKIDEKLVEIYSEILGIEKNKIGIDENFFKLGGHSLRAIKLVSRIHKEFNVKISLVDIFETPTIRKLSGHLKKTKKDKYTALEPGERKEYYPLSSAQKRLYAIQQMELESTSYNIPIFLLLEGKMDREKLEETFRKLIKRHESLRTSFEIIAGEPVQRIYEDVAFKIKDFGIKGEVESEIINSFVQPFDLSRTPLLRSGLLKQKQTKHILMLDMHHIVTDGFSYGIFVKEFMAIYKGEYLPPLKLTYKDYVWWQVRLSGSAEIKNQEEYWLKQLAGDFPTLEMLTDYPRPEIKSFVGESINFVIDKECTDKLQLLTRETGTTLHIILLAIYNVLLSKYTGQEDIIIGSGAAGRRHADLEYIIGMFVNMLPMRNHPLETMTFRNFLTKVKENALNAYENQEYQFDELVKKTGVLRDYNRNPIFDTEFTFQEIDEIYIEIPGLTLTPYKYNKMVMQFDLSLNGFVADDTIAMSLQYSTALFKESTARYMTRHYVEILRQVLENIHIKLKDIKISHDLIASRSDLSRDDALKFGF